MAEHFDAVDVIRIKRDKGELSQDQIDWVIDAYTRGVVADEQMSALAMAIFLNGMNRREIAQWTQAMINSGETMSFSSLSRPTADKHSTAVWVTKSPSPSLHWWHRLEYPFHSFPDEGLATPAEHWTNWNQSQAGRQTCLTIA